VLQLTHQLRRCQQRRGFSGGLREVGGFQLLHHGGHVRCTGDSRRVMARLTFTLLSLIPARLAARRPPFPTRGQRLFGGPEAVDCKLGGIPPLVGPLCTRRPNECHLVNRSWPLLTISLRSHHYQCSSRSVLVRPIGPVTRSMRSPWPRQSTARRFSPTVAFLCTHRTQPVAIGRNQLQLHRIYRGQ